MGQTVNLLTSSSVVRIHLTPQDKQLAICRFNELEIEKIKNSKNKQITIGFKAEVAQLVELQPSKLEVAGSRPVFRSKS